MSAYPILQKASVKVIDDWKLVRGGVGFEWKTLDYDISLKSLLENNAIFTSMQNLQSVDEMVMS